MRKFLLGIAMLSFIRVEAQPGQMLIQRIEQMPKMPVPYEMRDWKAVAGNYVDLVLNPHEGACLPLSFQHKAGVNYAQYQPIYLDTYVGCNAHANGSEAINVIPAVVSAYLTETEKRSSLNLLEGVMDFYNQQNGEQVYLNGFSSRSGHDWWYDVMPNVYFYQLYQLAQLPDEAEEQYISVADRWLEAVHSLGGDTFFWRLPNMNYRAFNLMTQQPLATGVKEPESAGAIAWILYHAYLETGVEKYRKGAELAMEFLNGLSSNPSYELQLAYGVQAAAKMNAMLGTVYDLKKMFGWCFERGPLRGWGSIVGNWGGYDVSGLIGEANDKGNDYAFVMNGFQQAAALAPVPKYDKRFAKAYARWMLNLANASRLFYWNGLPEANQESASAQWGRTYDVHATIPFEAIKEVWEDKRPFAMGDAVKGKWASTNLSLYSGSSVGYLAAVVEKTEVEGILQLDLNRTDLDGQDKYPTYLYYNPHAEGKKISLGLPEGSFRVYDALSESFLAESASGHFSFEIPADEARMLTLVPADVSVSRDEERLYAGDIVLDYHIGYQFKPTFRIKNLGVQNTYLQKDKTVSARAAVEGASPSAHYLWFVDGQQLPGLSGTAVQFKSTWSLGKHWLKLQVDEGNKMCCDSVPFHLLEYPVELPEITALELDATMPVAPAEQIKATVYLKNMEQPTDIEWRVSGGEIGDSDGKTSKWWLLPDKEGLYTLTCKASTVRGSVVKDITCLVRKDGEVVVDPLLYFPFQGSLSEAISGKESLLCGAGSPAYVTDVKGETASALSLEGSFFYYPNSPALNFRDAISLSLWICPQQKNGLEQFIVSHGSWQDRCKLSLNPDMTLRWTVKTDNGIADLDYAEPLPLHRFSHFVVTYTGYALELYHNGELYAYKPLTGKLGVTEQNLTVGAMNMTEQNYNYRGAVDELRVFDYALQPNQIEKLACADGVSLTPDVKRPAVYSITKGHLDFREVVTDAHLYTLTGIEMEIGQLATGIYILHYRLANRVYVEKIYVP